MAYKGQPTATSLRKEMTANKTFGMPVKGMKMTKQQVAKRKRTMIGNAAHKAFNTNYSK